MQGDEESQGKREQHDAGPLTWRSSRSDPPVHCDVIQISMHAADVKSILRVYSIEVAARERDDLNEDPIVVRLRKVRTFFPRCDAHIS